MLASITLMKILGGSFFHPVIILCAHLFHRQIKNGYLEYPLWCIGVARGVKGL